MAATPDTWGRLRPWDRGAARGCATCTSVNLESRPSSSFSTSPSECIAANARTCRYGGMHAERMHASGTLARRLRPHTAPSARDTRAPAAPAHPTASLAAARQTGSDRIGQNSACACDLHPQHRSACDDLQSRAGGALRNGRLDGRLSSNRLLQRMRAHTAAHCSGRHRHRDILYALLARLQPLRGDDAPHCRLHDATVAQADLSEVWEYG